MEIFLFKKYAAKALTQLERGAGRFGVESLPSVRQLQPVEQADGGARRYQLVVGQADIGVMQGDADTVAGAIAGDQGPRRQAAAAAREKRKLRLQAMSVGAVSILVMIYAVWLFMNGRK